MILDHWWHTCSIIMILDETFQTFVFTSILFRTRGRRKKFCFRTMVRRVWSSRVWSINELVDHWAWSMGSRLTTSGPAKSLLRAASAQQKTNRERSAYDARFVNHRSLFFFLSQYLLDMNTPSKGRRAANSIYGLLCLVLLTLLSKATISKEKD